MIKPFAWQRLYLWRLVGVGLLLFNYCAGAVAVPEYQLKAAYLIHLSEFTTWPAEKMQQPFFNICIATGSSLSEPLEQISGHKVKEKTLNIIYDVTIDKLKDCHVFYVEDKLNKKFFQQNLQKNTAILTVSSDASFTKEGGIIEYYLDDEDKIKMRVNLKALSQSQLIMSYKVLRLMDSNF
jgi:hypothetical protein